VRRVDNLTPARALRGGPCSVAGVNNEVLTGPISYSTGGRTVTCTYAVKQNYTAGQRHGAITINPALLTVTTCTRPDGSLGTHGRGRVVTLSPPRGPGLRPHIPIPNTCQIPALPVAPRCCPPLGHLLR